MRVHGVDGAPFLLKDGENTVPVVQLGYGFVIISVGVANVKSPDIEDSEHEPYIEFAVCEDKVELTEENRTMQREHPDTMRPKQPMLRLTFKDKAEVAQLISALNRLHDNYETLKQGEEP